ncbi:MAG: DedA family protein [Gammaproteobacteria bacterium]|nr:DedA family protein [Gammaproteobacteria bacterium]
MKIFTSLYDRAISWSRHRQAVKYLGGVSFIESSFFPVPTAVLLAPMVMARRDRAWWLAGYTTITSVLGGVFGYFIGFFLFDQAGRHILDFYQLQDQFVAMQGWFDTYGIWVVFLAGLTPIPYKLFTITSGAMSLGLVPFILASLVGRSSQFFLIAVLVKWGGEKAEPLLYQHMERIGWGVLILAVIGYISLR